VGAEGAAKGCCVAHLVLGLYWGRRGGGRGEEDIVVLGCEGWVGEIEWVGGGCLKTCTDVHRDITHKFRKRAICRREEMSQAQI